MYDNLKDYSNEKLIQMYNNAYATYCQAGGHGKARYNKIQSDKYRDELIKREVKFVCNPYNEGGIFNGEGAV